MPWDLACPSFSKNISSHICTGTQNASYKIGPGISNFYTLKWTIPSALKRQFNPWNSSSLVETLNAQLKVRLLQDVFPDYIDLGTLLVLPDSALNNFYPFAYPSCDDLKHFKQIFTILPSYCVSVGGGGV